MRCVWYNGGVVGVRIGVFMKELEKTLKALANRRRLAILTHLKGRKEATVGDIAAAIKLSFRATSKHLGILAAAEIVEREQRSLNVYYRLAAPQKPLVRSVLNQV